MRLYRPEEARAFFIGKYKISKPTFYDWVNRGVFRKSWPDGIPKNGKTYYITNKEIERIKELMDTEWVQGKAKIPKK